MMPLATEQGDEDSTTTDNRRVELHQVPNSSDEVLESGCYLPSDIVMSILSRLPVKTLFRFKSLCTNWSATIPANRHLVSMHLRNYTNNPATKPSLFCLYREFYFIGPLKSALFDPDDAAPGPIDLDNHWLHEVICGASNGLLLLGNPYQHRDPDYRLCNLATRQIRSLPDPPLAPPVLKHRCDYCGVGIDLAADDVKVVLVRNYAGSDDATFHPSPVFVYTLGSNCWTELAAVRYPSQERRVSPIYKRHVYFNGFIYWRFIDDYDHRNPDDYVMAFDTGRDVFHKIDCPVGTSPSARLGVHRDSLALIDISRHVWLLRRDGDDGGGGGRWRWIEHPGFGPIHGVTCVKGCWKDDQIIGQVRDRGELVLYDTGSRKCRVLMDECRMVECLVVYRESLSLH